MIETTTKIEDIIGYNALFNSLQKCKKGVGWKSTTGYYIHNWNTELLKMEEELSDGTYQKRKPKFFMITEPKVREIMSIHFRDRIYIRSFNDNALYPQITRSLIPDNFACQKGKGTLSARERFRDFIRDFYRKNGIEGYALTCDIKGYYPNMNRKFVKKMVTQYVDPLTDELVQAEIDYHPGDIGFNPGEQTIQNIGILALNKMDHYIKERLRIKYYIRYMDDFILMDPDKKKLITARERIAQELARIGLHLSEKKTFIQSIDKPILFLGFKFRINPTGKVVILADPKKIKHEKLKLKRMAALVAKGERTKYEVDRHFKAWKVTVRYGDSKLLLQNLNKWYKELWTNGSNQISAESGRTQGYPERNRGAGKPESDD